ncbi:MAG: bifunctional diaminohydroxyphosphoribosylaminopyrimidine deaminase/5-amino-6-(5-phosphoribosylamino)uracil reductase RibD [Candidatus Gastranaerophilales bacterium]|nr:bifunctional diaminohydroxyphosphoribosylaminopyrimidine deaminase/5-amino-6-(5-phosphoribosylamino)uracil reductase RibD [Candidatus Gastranaerophilales bacterium]
MQKCINLARRAKGQNFPNPFVGAIVYDEEKKEIISSGFHEKYGKAHAEVNAIKNANGNTKNKTIIVNLEPCSHYGKTPPCSDLIIKSGFKKCVIAMLDPNKKASGGAQKLKNAGIEVISGVLEKEARDLNKFFLKNIQEKKPYVMLKCATTLDGKIALENGKSKWITNEKARKYVHNLRSEYQAIMSASGTILKDNPKLNVRLKNKKSPIRIIFDPNNKIPLDYNVFNNDNRIILINNSTLTLEKHIEQINFDGNFDNLFKKLYELGITSIMIEAGCGFNSLLLKNNEVDEINQFIAPKIFGEGLNFVNGFNFKEINDTIHLKDIKIKQMDDNLLINGKIKTY